MADLIPLHGGLTTPVNLTVPAAEIEAFKAEAAKLPKVPVSDADLSTVYRFADGVLSPLTGPMDKATYQPRARRIGHRAQRQAVCLDNSACRCRSRRELATTLKPGQKVALTKSGRRCRGHARHQRCL